MKTIETVEINDTELAREKINDAAARYTCVCCGRKFSRVEWNSGELLHVVTPKQPVHGVHACVSCLFKYARNRNECNLDTIHGYHEDLPSWYQRAVNTATNEGHFTYTVEFEGAPKTAAFGGDVGAWALYAYNMYGLFPTQDCTVPVEMHAQTRASLRGVQDYITGVASILDMDICNAGQHINVSGQWLNGYKAHKLYLYREALFSDLFAEMEKDAATCKRVWGRNFGQWNNDPRVVGYTGHGTALNLAHLNEGAQARIEWRMCKFNNVKQFVDLLFLVQEFNLILEQFASGERTTKSAARSMVKKYRACASGRLAAQKRNK